MIGAGELARGGAMTARCALVAALLLALPLLAGACDVGGGDPGVSFEDALPLESSLQVITPGDETLETGAPGDVDDGVGTQAGGLGTLPSSFQQAAVNQSRVLNHYLKSIRLRITGLMSGKAAYKDQSRRVWIAVGLQDKVHALAMERHEDGHFSYQVLYRPDAEEPLVWLVVVAGTYTPGENRQGQGAIWIDLDQDAKPQSTGVVLALWSRDDDGVVISASVHDADTGDPDGPGGGARTEAYHYEKHADGGGLFVFDTHLLQPNPDGAGMLPRLAHMIARWRDDGSGRADAALPNGGPVPGAVALESQCWAPRPDYELVFEGAWLKLPGDPDVHPVADGTSGDADACAFPNRGKPVLPPQGDIPETPDPFPWFIEAAADKSAAD